MKRGLCTHQLIRLCNLLVRQLCPQIAIDCCLPKRLSFSLCLFIVMPDLSIVLTSVNDYILAISANLLAYFRDNSTRVLRSIGASILAVTGVSFALPALGFTAGGVAAGSTAAAVQSSIGLVPAGGWFAALQSLGATGMTTQVGTVIATTTGFTTYYIAKAWEWVRK